MRTQPAADWNAEACFANIQWHQRWEIFPGIFTPGHNPIDFLCDAVGLPANLTGKRVLDVGALHGCASFECERRGADEVVALSLENPDAYGFHRLKDALRSNVRYVQGSVYNLSPEELGHFDVILFFGVLYHLRYPLLAVDRLRTVCSGDVYVETHLTTSRYLLRKPWSYVSKAFNLLRLFRCTPIWRQYTPYEIHPDDQSNWFGPNEAAVLEAFASAGFTIRHCKSWGVGGERGAFHATLTDPEPDRLCRHSYEGWSPLHSNLVGVENGGMDGFSVS